MPGKMGGSRRPKSTPRTPAELDAAARVTGADVQHARDQWRTDAPPPLRGLLDARAREDAKPTEPPK